MGPLMLQKLKQMRQLMLHRTAQRHACLHDDNIEANHYKLYWTYSRRLKRL
jgi:hypothetical protein